MKPETILVGALLAMGVFVTLFTVVFDIAEDNGVNPDMTAFDIEGDSFYESFAKFNETKSDIDEIQSDFDSTTLSDANDVFSFLQLGLRTLKQVLASFNIVKEIFISLGIILGIDPLWVGIFTTILMIVTIIMIIFIILGRTY